MTKQTTKFNRRSRWLLAAALSGWMSLDAAAVMAQEAASPHGNLEAGAVCPITGAKLGAAATGAA
ncbi:MAG: hypothetical protein ACKO9H_14055, partial [Planctomycetota bacterium]